MATFIVTFAVFALAAMGLGVGYLLQNRELKGSCGGISAMNGEPCPVCGGEPADCDREPAAGAKAAVKTYKPS